MAKNRWTADRVYGLLKQRFPSPAFELLAQVRNTTGYAKRERYADAIAVSVFPSRGVYLTGIEIKVSKSDWRKELANPDKANAIQKHCRYWYVAAPKGVVPVDELPDDWGLLECSGNSIVATKAPTDGKPEPPDWLLVASILRNASKSMISHADSAEMMERLRESSEKDRIDAMKLGSVQRELDSLRLAVSAFESESGIQFGSQWQYGKIGEAVRDIVAGRSMSATRQKEMLVRVARNILEEIGDEPKAVEPKNDETELF